MPTPAITFQLTLSTRNVWCMSTFNLSQPQMEAQSNRTSTMLSSLLHFHINLRLVRVVVGMCVYVVWCGIQKCNVYGDPCLALFTTALVTL